MDKWAVPPPYRDPMAHGMVSPQAMGCAWLNVQPSASESAIVSGEAKALLRVALAAA
jgi:hypothetical protein